VTTNITAVRVALAAQIERLVYPALRSLAEPEDSINPPVGIVMPGRPYLTYGTTLQGETGFLGDPAQGDSIASVDFALDYLIVLSHASTLERIEANLDAWLGFESDSVAVSVPAAVAADPTLGGVVDWCVPTTADPPGPLEWSGPAMFGTRIHFNFSA
jgi:hypothetical protein